MLVYNPVVDTPRADFWTIHNQVIASLPTLRADRNNRHERLLDAPNWDMLIVDEAHHLNADEVTGKTLGYQLVERLVKEQRVESCLLFSGTPHRGKPYGFWSLMSLLRPEVFSPHRDQRQQLRELRKVLIRNFKQKVTDMAGNRLFQPILNHPETYEYTEAESNFYRLLTRFIMAGNAYASQLDQSGRNQVNLVLIAMQKIASSSIAAIRAALRKRLANFDKEMSRLQADNADRPEDEGDDLVFDALIKWEREQKFKLMENERLHLEELLQAAEAITEESKIERIAEIIQQRYPERSILLFTEYKATQAWVVSTLMRQFGEEAVGFINGDNRLPSVRLPSGKEAVLSKSREVTAEAFNQGNIRFLVSTEAGGEGIDLQARCHTLIHVDLPWNPMRLHQRVGRLNRYGQTQPVEVLTVRNPNTVESRIWGKLEQKLGHIMQALGHAMDEPEDLMQMVLGMTGTGFFNDLFAEGVTVHADKFDAWFDAKTQSLGGHSALDTVQDLVGHCQSFDLSQLDDVPRKDLPDLIPFFKGMLAYNRRRPEINDAVFTFRTPEAWLDAPGVRNRYEGLIFHRNPRDHDESKRIVGVGHQAFDKALAQAKGLPDGFTVIEGLSVPLAVFQFQDAVTSQSGHVRQVLAGAMQGDTGDLTLLQDEEVLELLNHWRPEVRLPDLNVAEFRDSAYAWLSAAKRYASDRADQFNLPFIKPLINDVAVFWPWNTVDR